MAALPPAAYRFGPFLVDRAGYRVLRDNRPLDLTPKLLDLLLYLLDHAGTLVTKEALLDALWLEANVTDNALTQAVSELRQALGDDAADPRFIKTVARRGYRFVAPVHPLPEAATASEHHQGAADQDAIAVLDFTNVSGDPESAWLSAGIAETVSADLRALGRFHVLDRWRVAEAARRTGGTVQEIAEALRTRLVVVGSYQCQAERVRITARVLDILSGEAVADAKVDGLLADVFDLQDEVCAQFARELGVTASGVADAPRSRETSSLDAYRAVMEGWLRIETLDVRELPLAIDGFTRAVAIDPHYALAYTGLATAEFASYEATRSSNEPARPLLENAIAHGRQAIRLDDGLAEAHGALALILVSAWDTAGAIRSARRAVALEPGNWRHLFRLGHATWGHERLRAGEATLALYPDFAFTHFQSAMVHVARAHLAEAERVLRHGAAVQDRQIGRGERYPALGLHWLLGLVRLAQDDVSEAIEEFDRERELALPHRLYGREYAVTALAGRGAALLKANDRDRAADSFREALSLAPDYPQGHLGLAIAQRAPFVAVEATLQVLDRTKPIEAAVTRAQLHAVTGDAEAAASALARMLQYAPAGFAGWSLPADPFIHQVAESKAVQAMLARLAERAR
jgi:DNA-binding winged helix-turn-helix (wHTH) protein/Flp pilus assembly protein TadD